MENSSYKLESNCADFPYNTNSGPCNLKNIDQIPLISETALPMTTTQYFNQVNDKMSATFYQQNIYQFYNNNYFYGSFQSGDKFEENVDQNGYSKNVYGDFKTDELFQNPKEVKQIDYNSNWSPETSTSDNDGSRYFVNEDYRFCSRDADSYDGFSTSDQRQIFSRTTEGKKYQRLLLVEFKGVGYLLPIVSCDVELHLLGVHH